MEEIHLGKHIGLGSWPDMRGGAHNDTWVDVQDAIGHMQKDRLW